MLTYEEDFREQSLKINDDRRIQINLSKLIPSQKKAEENSKNSQSASSLTAKGNQAVLKGKMILLTVKI